MVKYVDDVEVRELIRSKTYYTWFLCVDGKVRRVSTYDYQWLREVYMVSV